MGAVRERWFSRRAIGMHLALLVTFPGCLLAMWWQIHVALAGDSLGWLYSVEWPFFACFGAYVWWNLIHDTDAVGTRRLREAGRRLAGGRSLDLPEAPSQELQDRLADQDPDLAAYNAYLPSLAEQGPQRWSRR